MRRHGQYPETYRSHVEGWARELDELAASLDGS